MILILHGLKQHHFGIRKGRWSEGTEDPLETDLVETSVVDPALQDYALHQQSAQKSWTKCTFSFAHHLASKKKASFPDGFAKLETLS
jgi:hypothetical protein